MSRVNISQELKTLLKEHIHSVFSLEVLLLLRRERIRSFTAAEVARAVGLEIDVAQQQLSELTSARLIETMNGDVARYRYAPLDEKLPSLVDQLAVAYAKQRVPILSLILTEHQDRIRCFVEAYRLNRVT
jgi:hypothetical protein